MSSFKATFFA